MKPANATVNGRTTLDHHGSAYELDADVSWTTLNNVGISIGENKDGSRHTNIGVYGGNLYVDRSAQDQVPFSFGTYQQSQAPLASGATSVHLRILVDHGSVEVFADDGRIALSNRRSSRRRTRASHSSQSAVAPPSPTSRSPNSPTSPSKRIPRRPTPTSRAAPMVHGRRRERPSVPGPPPGRSLTSSPSRATSGTGSSTASTAATRRPER